MYRILLSIRPLPSSPALLEDVGDDVADAAVFGPVDLRESSVSYVSHRWRIVRPTPSPQCK